MTLSKERWNRFCLYSFPTQTEKKEGGLVTRDCHAVGGVETQVLVAMVIWGQLMDTAHSIKP